MSNKRQLRMSARSYCRTTTTRMTHILSCDLKRVLGLNFVCILLLLVTSTTLIVESAKLEANKNNRNLSETETVTKSTTIKIATNDDGDVAVDDDNNHSNRNVNNKNNKADEALLLRQQHKHNTLDEAAENFYHSELQRLSYDTIHSILRDENEPIYRREDNDRRYYHAKSLQPTHEIMKREADEFKTFTPTTPTTNQQLKTNNFDINLSLKALKTINITAYEHSLNLNLSHNQLSELPLSVNSTIVQLDLNSNRIQKAVAPLNKHLKTLLLSGNQIENLAALNLSQLIALETLDLSCNRIQNLETSFFPQLMHNLKYLNLAHNHLGTISRETFYNLLSLNTLLLAHNNITNIDYETFLSLPNLQYLDLSHNQLKGESIRALQGIPDLIGLSIAYNPDMGESLQEFVASWSLKEVDASGTGLCQIPAALAQAVRTLKLADNWLKIINCGDLDSYPLLTQLDLSNSHIEDIEDDAMGRLEFLEILFLDHNHLRKVPVSLPTSLEHLFLQNNEIMDLQVQAFAGLKNLKTLDLSHNKLLYLPALPLPKLLTLNLQASGLQGLNQAIVHTLPHLRDLLLEENPIKCSDLLGIAEWASPCRIAERNVASASATATTATTTSKAIDGLQIANVGGGSETGAGDVGQPLQQQQMQTVAKIDLKAKFVQTHNFYEKFGGTCNCVGGGVGGSDILATKTIKPPFCAIELEDELVLKVEKPTVLTIAAKKLDAVQPNANFNEQHKLAQVKKSTTATPTSFDASKFMGGTKNANHAAAKMSATTKSFQPKKLVIANGTSAVVDFEIVDASATTTTVMPTTFLAINSTKSLKIGQTTAEPTVFLETTLSTSTLSNTLNKATDIAATKTPNLSLLLPATMTTKMTTRMPATSSTTTKAIAATVTSVPVRSLLERQRRLEATTLKTLLTTAATTLDTPTATAAPTTHHHQHENLARNIGNNDSQKMLLQRKSSNNFQTKNEFLELLATTTIATLPEPQINTPTTIEQHKHVTLQLNSKDRHLIGTPLLTHHGQNLMVAAEELKKNGNHITAKTEASNITTTAVATPTVNIQQKQLLDKSQNQQTEKEVNKFSKVHEAENVATTTPNNNIATPTTKPATAPKSSKKQLNEQKKKTTTLIMKKMTVTTTATKQQPTQQQNAETHQPHQQQQQQHRHYTLNIPKENEATLNGLITSTAHEQPSPSTAQHQTNNLKHHSTVNTPVINSGHENHEPQTFQEHNEIEEEAAIAARASISAKFNSKLHAHAGVSDEWSRHQQRQHARLHFDNPTVVFLVGITLFVTLVLSLLHAYRCKIPAIFNMQRQQQQRPHQQQHQQHQQQQQQLRIRNKTYNADEDSTGESASFLNGGSNQFQRQWRLERASNSQQQHQQPKQNSPSPFHNLQVRDLQQTSAIEPCPRYCKTSYNISSALGERSSNSQHTSSSCSPHSSCTFDDETCYIEMTTDVCQPISGAGAVAGASTSASISHGDLLPMELLGVARYDLNDQALAQEQSHQQHTTLVSHQTAFQTSAIDESSSSSLADVLANQNVSNTTKLTPSTRKLGLW